MRKKCIVVGILFLQPIIFSCHGCGNDNFLKKISALFDVPSAGSSYYPSYTIPETIPVNAIYVDQSHLAAADTNPGTADLPYKTISGALNNAHPGAGETIVVKAGTYYENNVQIPSGGKDNPFTLMANPGDRVIVSGLEIIATPKYTWTPVSGRPGVYQTTIGWKPVRLMRIDVSDPAIPKYYELTCARYPNDGWLAVEEVTNDPASCSFSDTHLMGLSSSDVEGGEAFMSLTEGNIATIIPITSFVKNATTATITLPLQEYVTLTKREDEYGNKFMDRYWLQNKVNFIDEPGDWAVEQPDPNNASQYILYYRPYNSSGGTVADTIGISGHQLQRIIFCNETSHARVIGLEVVGSDQYGIQAGYDASDILVGKCVAHHNGSVGIYVASSSDVIVARNISWWNGIWSIGGSVLGIGGTGISETGSSRVLIEMNDIAYNGSDGLTMTWGSDNITAQKNYIHNHLFWGHPDNIQTYRDLKNVTMKDNLLIGGGQSIMMQETVNGKITGNIIMGCGAYSVILGNVPNFIIRRNTILHSYYGSLSLIGYSYDIRENVIMTGNRGSVYSTRDSSGYAGDRNLVYNADIGYDGILITQNGWGRTLAQFQQDTGQDRNSRFGNPQFANMPDFFTQVEINMIHLCDTNTLIIHNDVTWLNTGDYIELNFDGTPRRIASKTDNFDANHYSITITPALSAKPLRICLIVKWADGVKPTLPMDATLSGSSPGADLSASGGPVGSSINIQAYKSGDFNNDGMREIPLLRFE
jgi:hypothetical protein